MFAPAAINGPGAGSLENVSAFFANYVNLILFAGDYTRWVFVTNVLAWPAAYFAANKWLQAFAFRTPVGLVPFILAGLITLAVAVLSVIFQTMRAARANPVRSLRYE